MKNKKKLIRITTIPISLEKLLENQLRFMGKYYEITAVSSDKTYLESVGVSQGVAVFYVEMTRQITPFKDLKAVWELYNYFKKEKPFIVHTHTPKAGTVGMIAAKLAGVPYRLHTIAGLPLLEAKGNKRRLLDAVEKITYACATMVYPNSRGLKKIIIEQQFCNSEKLKVIGNGSSNGINTAYFNPEIFFAQENQLLKTNIGITPDDFVFIFVGRLVGDKGINELVAAFELFSNPGSCHPERSRRASLQRGKGCVLPLKQQIGLNPRQTKLLLVGPFESKLDPLQKETLETIIDNKNIISVGFQKDVRPYFAISDCLAFPSYREGFPNVVMQAGAMGLPSIVTNINGCNEIIIEGENGVIIPVKDTAAVYQAMKKMVEDNALRNYLHQNARPMIVRRYEQSVVWEAILAEYKRLEHHV